MWSVSTVPSIEHALSAVEDPGEAIAGFIEALSYHVHSSECRLGGPLTTVALETASSSTRINGVCQEMYRSWQRLFQAKLETGGYSSERAASLAVFVNAAIEGGIILSRTLHSVSPLQSVAQELRLFLAQKQE